ncbi:bifunctional nicotinamide-nucleotide adenylyltransferase/Nudix hydroxylase [Giesbergeria sinuosa]
MMYDTAIYIGRFEPVHSGHIALLQHALAQANNVVVVLGSAWQPRSPKNPFTWQERAEMLRQALPTTDQARVQCVAVRDYYNEARWVASVRQEVAARVPAGARIALVGHFKDASSNYLRSFPGWALLDVPRHGTVDATAIRDAYFGAGSGAVLAALAPLADQMPATTLAQLHRFAQSKDYLLLQQEWQMLRQYRAAWASAPYAPVFVTVDALLCCQQHVLLIRRGHAPGVGQLALPGGFLEPRDTLWQSCLRELAEETHCHVPEDTLRAALRQVSVFDHPDRSQRGRTLTHTHYFDLGAQPLPTVQAGDDAAQVQWVPMNQLAALEAEFFEDHFHMLDHFLGLTSSLPTAPL